MSYIIRNDKGVMIALVDNMVAKKIIDSSQGQFRPYHAEGKEPVTAYEITDDLIFGAQAFKLCLWAKTLLIPEKP